MHWALRWVVGWLLFLWAIRDGRDQPKAPPEPKRPSTDWTGPYVSSFRITTWPSLVAEPPAPRGLDVERLGALLKRSEPPQQARLVSRELAPDLYEVHVPDEWMAEVARNGRIVPAFRNGRAYGFKLFSVGYEYVQLGLRNGDVLLQLNGVPLASPDSALDAYASLRDAKRIVLGLERDGRLLTKTYLLNRTLVEGIPQRSCATADSP